MHGIMVKDGKAQMAFVGETPWHSLGNALGEGESIERWQEESGLNYKVLRSKVRFATEQEPSQFMEWPERHVLFRSDTKAPLGMVSDAYNVVQPKQVLEFFRDLTEQNGFKLNTAGVLFGGQRYWALASTGHMAEAGKGDALKGYLLLATSCDGTLATQAKFTSVRVVCNNTLSLATRSKGAGDVVVRHSSVFKDTKIKADLGLMQDSWGIFEQNIKKLAKRKVLMEEAAEMVAWTIGDPEKFNADRAASSGMQAIKSQPNAKGMQRILDLFSGKGKGAELASSKNTAWGLVNAATEYFDHDYGRDDSNRLTSAWFGPNQKLKQAIYEEALLRA